MYETTKSVLQIGWTVIFHFLRYVVASRKLSPQFSLSFSFLTLSVINRFMFHFILFPWGRWSTKPQTHQTQKWLYTTNSGCFHRPNPGSRSCWWASHSLDLAHRQILFNQHNILNIWKFCESFLIFDLKIRKKSFHMDPRSHMVTSSWTWSVSATGSTIPTALHTVFCIDSNCL